MPDNGSVEWETVFSTAWFSIKKHDRPDPENPVKAQPFYKLSTPDGVVVIPVMEDGRLVLIRQFRPALARSTLEFPAGTIDAGEAPAEAAARELYEETGYRCTSLKPVLEGGLRLDREDARNFFFLGEGAALDPAFRPTEQISTLPVTPA